MMEKKNYIIFTLIWFVIVIMGSFYIVSDLNKETLWYDESYSSMIIKQPLQDIVRITASDSHPPLYYLVLSLYSKVSGNNPPALRFFSFLGVLALAIAGLTSIRKIMGKEVAIIYTFFLFLFPVFVNMGQEVRMYTWAAFLVTSSAIEIFNFIHREKKYSWLKFLIFSILAMWTHYFSLIAIAIMDIIVLFWIIYRRKKWAIIPFFALVIIQIITYLPWSFALFSQMSRVSKDFWIQKVDLEALFVIFLFPFSDKFFVFWIGRPWTDLIALIFSIALVINGIIKAVKTKRERDRFALFSFLIYFFTLLAGIFISEFFRPILVPRYLTTVHALLILFIAYSISKISNSSLKYISIAVFVVSLIPVQYFIRTNEFNGAMDKVVTYLQGKITSQDVFLHIDEHTFGTFVYYFPENKHYLYLGPAYKGYSGFDAFKPNGFVLTNRMAEFVSKNKTFWLVNRPWAPQTLLCDAWIVTGKLVPENLPEIFQYRASFYRPKIFKVSTTTNIFSEYEWGNLNTTNLLDPHSYSDKALNLMITVNGLRKIKGEIKAIIYENNIIPENLFMFQTKRVTGQKVEFVFEEIPAGKYSIFVYQDLNTNEKPDRFLNMFIEPAGFSGNNMDKSEVALFSSTNVEIYLR